MPGFALCKPYMTGIITQVTGQDTTTYGGKTPIYGYDLYGLATVKHGLGYMPVCMIFGVDPLSGIRPFLGVDTQNIYASCDNTGERSGTTGTVNWPYVIFRDQLP